MLSGFLLFVCPPPLPPYLLVAITVAFCSFNGLLWREKETGSVRVSLGGGVQPPQDDSARDTAMSNFGDHIHDRPPLPTRFIESQMQGPRRTNGKLLCFKPNGEVLHAGALT